MGGRHEPERQAFFSPSGTFLRSFRFGLHPADPQILSPQDSWVPEDTSLCFFPRKRKPREPTPCLAPTPGSFEPKYFHGVSTAVKATQTTMEQKQNTQNKTRLVHNHV